MYKISCCWLSDFLTPQKRTANGHQHNSITTQTNSYHSPPQDQPTDLNLNPSTLTPLSNPNHNAFTPTLPIPRPSPGNPTNDPRALLRDLQYHSLSRAQKTESQRHLAPPNDRTGLPYPPQPCYTNLQARVHRRPHLLSGRWRKIIGPGTFLCSSSARVDSREGTQT